MPAIPAILWWFGGGAALGTLFGGAVGFAVGDGVDGVSRVVRWGAIGAGIYVGGKALKVL